VKNVTKNYKKNYRIHCIEMRERVGQRLVAATEKVWRVGWG